MLCIPMPRSITDQLKTAIRRSGLTAYRLSKKSGVSQGTLSKLKSGSISAVTLETAEALAAAMDLELVLTPIEPRKRSTSPAAIARRKAPKPAKRNGGAA